MSHTPGPYVIGEPGGPAGPFYSIVSASGRVVAMQIPNRDDAVLWTAAPEMYEACERIAARPAEAVEMMRREGFAIDNLDDRWQKLAFTLYGDLVASAQDASAAIAAAEAET